MSNKKEKKDLRENKFWLKLWSLLEPSQKNIKGLLLVTVLFELARLIGPFLLKLIVDSLVVFSPENIPYILALIGLMFLSEELNSFISYLKDKKIFEILIDVEYYLPVNAHKKLVSLSLSYHEKENTGNKIIKIEKGVTKIIDLLANMSWEVVPTVVSLFVALIVLFVVDYRFGLSFIIFAPLFILITYKSNKALQPVRKKRYKDYEVASGKMGQAIININAVKSFVQEKREVREYGVIRKLIKINENKEWSKMLKSGLFRNFIIDLGRSTILLLGVYLAWQGQVTIGTLIFVITLSEKAYFSLYRLSRFYDRMEEGKEAVNRFVDLNDEEPNIINSDQGIKPKRLLGKIEFKNVSFSYEDDKYKALTKVNLKINSGCVTALIGPSGGGKTTVARMVYRHYDPTKGEILLDDKNIKEYDLYGFRKFIAIVPQEVEIFNSSISDNISYANRKASIEEIKAAAKIANAEEFIDQLSEGYDTLVGERGIKLSGGQRQRVGIARAILANPRILIFDEATSSLDSYSEKLIQESMERISRGRTMIIIAHRLSTIKKADKIIVLEEGKLVEQGSHLELSKVKGGLYAKLLKLQEVGDID
jgi:ABC-type multidrug transport system fused ATPase/permease subunit